MKFLINGLPLVVFCVFCAAVGVLGGISAIPPIYWAMLVLTLIASVLMLQGKWWGCLPGIAAGILLLNMGLETPGQIINEAPVGAFLFAYWTALGYAKKKNRR